jgi:hypothetical protein
VHARVGSASDIAFGIDLRIRTRPSDKFGRGAMRLRHFTLTLILFFVLGNSHAYSYGALVIGEMTATDGTTIYHHFVASDRITQKEALDDALRLCQQDPRRLRCRVFASFNNNYLAIVYLGGRWDVIFTATGSTASQAERNAMDKCLERPHYLGCTGPEVFADTNPPASVVNNAPFGFDISVPEKIMGSLSIWHWMIVVVLAGILVAVILALSRRGRETSFGQAAFHDQNLSSLRNYDTEKWDALVKYDKDVASAVMMIGPLGQKWVDELARSYFALGDKTYLQNIVAKIQEEAATPAPPPQRSATAETMRPADVPKQAVLPQRGGENLAKGAGIAALALAILAIFIPLYGLFIAAIASVCAVISALAGDRIFAIAVPVITFANLLFLSPSFWYIQNNSSNKAPNYVILCILVGAPFVAMYLYQNGKLKIGGKI